MADKDKIMKRLETIAFNIDHQISELRKEISARTTKIETLMDTKGPIYKLIEDIDSDGDQ